MSKVEMMIYCRECMKETPCEHVGNINPSVAPVHMVDYIPKHQTVDHILARHGIHTVDDLDQALNLFSTAFDDLYEYYLNSGEMPYGVAKARTGDPGTWIYEQVAKHLEE